MKYVAKKAVVQNVVQKALSLKNALVCCNFSVNCTQILES